MPEQSDPPGLGEIGRNVREVRDDMKSLAASVHAFQLDLTAVRHEVTENTKDIAEIRSDQRSADQSRAADRRLFFTAIIAPAVIVVFGIIVQVALSSRGAL